MGWGCGSGGHALFPRAKAGVPWAPPAAAPAPEAQAAPVGGPLRGVRGGDTKLGEGSSVGPRLSPRGWYGPLVALVPPAARARGGGVRGGGAGGAVTAAAAPRIRRRQRRGHHALARSAGLRPRAPPPRPGQPARRLLGLQSSLRASPPAPSRALQGSGRRLAEPRSSRAVAAGRPRLWKSGPAAMKWPPRARSRKTPRERSARIARQQPWGAGARA